MRVAVVGHVEWAEVFAVAAVPMAGDVVDADSLVAEPAGAGGIGAVQLAKLAGEVIFFTALADDELGRRAYDDLVAAGVRVESAWHNASQRRAIVHVDAAGDRAITVAGPKLVPRLSDPLPWAELCDADVVAFYCGDEDALRAARQARVLVATSRWLPVLERAGVPLDALVGSARDPRERYGGSLEPPPRLVVMTEGAAGGRYSMLGVPTRRFAAALPNGPALDAYGCGDSFLAGLAFALGKGDGPADAVEFAARCGAACLTARGAFAGQMRLVDS